MTKRNSSQTLLVTGASRGIGRAIALKFAAQGAHLFLLGRDRHKLQETADRCIRAGGSATIVLADIQAANEMRNRLLELDSQRPIDLVIANAGVTSGLSTPGGTEPWEDLQEVARTNFLGTLNTIAPLLDNMIARKSGQIAIIGSLAAAGNLPFCPSYSAAKAGIETYGRALRAALKHHNIRVTVVSPGFVETEMSQRIIGSKPFMVSPERAAEIIRTGLQKNKALVVFPRRLGWLTRLSVLLPEPMLIRCQRLFAFTVAPRNI